MKTSSRLEHRRLPPASLRVGAVCLAAALAVAAATSACWWGRRERPRGRPADRVILILLDAARADRLSTNSYPRKTTPEIDRMARRGVVFLRHFSQDTATTPSLPSLFFSRYFAKPLFPMSPKVPLSDPADLFRRNDPQSISLPAALSPLGYWTALISAHVWLKPGTPLAAEFDEVHDLTIELDHPVATGGAEQTYPRAREVVDFAIEWTRKNVHRKYFLYLHLMDTHFPHPVRKEARSFMHDAGLDDGQIQRLEREGWRHHAVAPREVRSYVDGLYDGSLRYADRELGRLFAELDEQRALEDTLIVITADHGEHLLEAAGRMDHGGPWYDAVGHIPLVVFSPKNLAPGRVSSFTENVDILPTVMGLLGASLPPGKAADGVDLAQIIAGTRPPREYAVGGNAVRSERYKAIFGADGIHARSVSEIAGELYDLEADPLETRNLWGERPEVAAQLLEAYRSRVQEPYRRYVASTSDTQPDSAFAIASNSFEVSPAVPAGDEGSGWRSSDHWQGYHLLAQPDAPPVEVSFPIPNGTYRLTAAFMGSGELALHEGSAPVRLEGAPVGPEDHPKLDRVTSAEVATVAVTNRRFRARLLPTGRSRFLVRYFGFTPVGRDARPELDEERLRALGYVQ
jgi:arylsulfatase A-like enzyme